MKITVLNGSPKGDLSVTLQYIRFIQKKYPEIDLSIHHVSKKIKSIEKSEAKFQEIISDVASSDAVWWSVPIYVFLIPSQYKRFVEMIWEKGAQDNFKNKYTAVFTTSINFYDHTGNSYMHSVCDDLGMKFVDFYSAHMDDLFKEAEQDRISDFAGEFLEAVRTKVPLGPVFQPLQPRTFSYQPGAPSGQVDPGDRKVLLLVDQQIEGSNLEAMIQRFSSAFSGEINRINLSDVGIKGGCLGCIQCGFDNECVYDEGTDEYRRFYQENVVTADVVIYAGTIKDRYLSSAWKQFFDRRFFNTHIPTMTGKQVGYIVEGPLSQLANLREIFMATTELDHANLAGIVTDEFGDSSDIDARLDQLAAKLIGFSAKKFRKPSTFLGVGGRKIFRDTVWARLRFPFLADHKYYMENDYYDFPQNDTKSLEFSERLIEAIEDPDFKKVLHKSIRENMVAPIQKIVDSQE